jgi:hypothetical protein
MFLAVQADSCMTWIAEGGAAVTVPWMLIAAAAPSQTKEL